jgi:hypothetical protein
VTNQSSARTDRRRWAIAACAALVVAAVADGGPEILGSRSLIAGYDGPGPLIYLGVAIVVAAVRWRFMPLLAVATGLLFLVGGFANHTFVSRLGTPTDPLQFSAGWLQMIGFAAAAGCGLVAVRRDGSVPGRPANADHEREGDLR